MSLLIIAIIIGCTKAEEATTAAPETPTKNETAIAEAKVDFTDGIEMQIKKVTSADGKEISIIIKKEILPDSMVTTTAAPKRRRRDAENNIMDLEKLKNNKNFKLEKVKDAEGKEVEVYILEEDEKKNRKKRGIDGHIPKGN